jgi:hypothetical protein
MIKSNTPMIKLYLRQPSDIPFQWKRVYAKKKTGVTIRAVKPEGESFKVSWSESLLYADPNLDLIVRSELDGREYPCKKDIFTETYELAGPAYEAEGTIASYRYTKKTVNSLVEVPQGYDVTVGTLEGDVTDVQYPDYIAIGPKCELYVNTKKTVDENMEILP